MLAALETACVEVGRDPATIGRSVGVAVEPTSFTGAKETLGRPIRGSAEEIAKASGCSAPVASHRSR